MVARLRLAAGCALALLLSSTAALASDPTQDLLRAVGNHDASGVAEALARGGDPDATVLATPGMGRPALDAAMARLLARLVEPTPTTALCAAIDAMKAEPTAGAVIVDLLLQAGADPNATPTGADPPLVHLAALATDLRGTDAWVGRLLAAGARAEPAGAEAIARFAAPRTTDLGEEVSQVVARLLAAGASAHPGLCAASRRGDLPLARLLIPHDLSLAEPCPTLADAPVDAPPETPIDAAVRAHALPIVTALLAGGAHAHAALCAAAAIGDLDVAAIALASDRTIDAACPVGGHTPLLRAVRRGDTRAVALLLASGAHPDATAPPDHIRPLTVAVTDRAIDADAARRIVDFLVSAGADRGAPDADHRTPFEAALPSRARWLFSPMRPAEEAWALDAWARGDNVKGGWLPGPVVDGWSRELLAEVIDDLGREHWVELYAEAGGEVIGAAPSRMGVHVRALREAALDCPLTGDASEATVDGLLGPRLSRHRRGVIRVEERVGGTATWLKSLGRRWDLMNVDPAPIACSLLPWDLRGQPRAAIHIALGRPDLVLPDGEAWRLHAADTGRTWLWMIVLDAGGRVTATRLDRRVP